MTPSQGAQERSSSFNISSPRSWLKRRKKRSYSIPAPLRETMTLLKESSDWFPPLKGAVGGVCRIIDMVEAMKGNKEDAQQLYSRAEGLLNLLADTITDPFDIPPHLLIAVTDLDRNLHEIAQAALKVPRQEKAHVRFFQTGKEKDQLRVLLTKVDNALEGFKLASSIRIEQQVSILSTKTDSLLHTTQQLHITATSIKHTFLNAIIIVISFSFN